MAGKQKPPRIVAELGRPETPGETAARKAETSRLYRERKTVNNLVFSLLVSVAMVALIVLIVPRGTDQWTNYEVDVAELAEQSTQSAGRPLVAPQVPESWKAKQAVLRSDSVSKTVYWKINYTTENNAYAAVIEAFAANGGEVNPTWISQQLEEQKPTANETIGGLDWVVYDHPNRSPDEANMIFGLQSQVGSTTLLVYGTDRPEVLRTLAAEVAAQATSLDLAGAGAQPEEEAS